LTTNRSKITSNKARSCGLALFKASEIGIRFPRRAGLVSSKYFPRVIGLRPTGCCAKRAIIIVPLMLRPLEVIPSLSSFWGSPLRQTRVNAPCRFHSRKYLWIEPALPVSLLGKTIHWHPVYNRKNVLSKNLHASRALRPPLVCRKYFRLSKWFECGPEPRQASRVLLIQPMI
jgi:hypothetical protein